MSLWRLVVLSLLPYVACDSLDFINETQRCNYYCNEYSIDSKACNLDQCHGFHQSNQRHLKVITCPKTGDHLSYSSSSQIWSEDYLTLYNHPMQVLRSCEFSIGDDEPTRIRNDYETQHNETFPYILQLRPSSHEESNSREMNYQCIRQIHQTIQSIMLHSITPRQSIYVVHVSTANIQRLNELPCIQSLAPLPATMKLLPLARSFANYKSTQTTLPPLLIKTSSFLTKACIQTALNTQITAQLGIQNLLELHTTWNDNHTALSDYLILPSLQNIQTWFSIMAIIAHHPSVLWIDLFLQIEYIETQKVASMIQPLNLRHRRLSGGTFTNITDLLGFDEARRAGITGKNSVVGITDTGLYTLHDQFDQAQKDIYNKVDLNARKIVSYFPYGDQYDQSEEITCGHGTHVSAILAGKSATDSLSNGGIAYDAKIAFMDIGRQPLTCVNRTGCSVVLETPLRAESLLERQIEAGARVFSFSWGVTDSDYNTQAQDLDRYLYAHPEIIIVVAAGNAGMDANSKISSPGGAKNVITVGASLVPKETFLSLSNKLCPSILNQDTIAGFSSYGPTSDGRLKPDIVTPGQILESAMSLPRGSTEKTSQTCLLQGTSQSTPSAAGMALLLHEWLRDGWWKSGVYNLKYGMKTIPSSLIKALMIHSAKPLKRRLASNTLSANCNELRKRTQTFQTWPNGYQGYGRPDFRTIASFSSTQEKVFFLPNSTSEMPVVGQGEIHKYNYSVPHGQTLRITIAWTDPPSSMLSSQILQHDLDLTAVLVDTKKIFYPLTTKTTFDRVNNVEVLSIDHMELHEVYMNYLMTKNNKTLNITEVNETIIETRVYRVQAIVHGYNIHGTAQRYSMVSSIDATTAVYTQIDTDETSSRRIGSFYILTGIFLGILGIAIGSMFIIRKTRRLNGQQPSKTPMPPIVTPSPFR